MSIAINQSRCVGCGRCSQVWPGTLIGMDSDGKACMLYPKDCWGCCSCIKECKVDAIALYLGADMGGMGSKMSVASREQYLDWKIEKRDGSVETIVIDRKQSNQY